MLVGTISVEKSEHLARLLEKRGVPHHVLNDELAERAGGTGDAERYAALFHRERAADDTVDDAETAARERDTDYYSRAQVEFPAGRRIRHQHQPERVEQSTAGHHASGAEFVGDHAGERLRDAVDQVLNGERKRERLAVPAEIDGHRLQKKAETVTRAECHGERHAAAQQNHGGGAPVSCCCGSHNRFDCSVSAAAAQSGRGSALEFSSRLTP